jgi:ribonuclease P protein component
LTQTPTYRLGKKSRIKSRKLTEALFASGKSVAVFPLRAVYQIGPGNSELQAGFSVSKRNFKKATNRNRIKRLMREAYRLQKIMLENSLQQQQKTMQIFFLFTAKELPDYKLVYDKMNLLLQKLEPVNTALSTEK